MAPRALTASQEFTAASPPDDDVGARSLRPARSGVRRRRWTERCAALLVAASLAAGCASTPAPPPDPPLAGIENGRTTREEVLLKFGVPQQTFEDGRILGYHVFEDAAGNWRAPPDNLALKQHRATLTRATSLVFVFGPDGVLRKHSRVPPD